MSDSVVLGGDIGFSARCATLETIFAHLRRQVPNHEEFRPLLAREQEFERIGGWFFDTLSVDALLIVQQAVRELANDPEAAAHWNPERRPILFQDLAQFDQKLAERVSQLKPDVR